MATVGIRNVGAFVTSYGLHHGQTNGMDTGPEILTYYARCGPDVDSFTIDRADRSDKHQGGCGSRHRDEGHVHGNRDGDRSVRR